MDETAQTGKGIGSEGHAVDCDCRRSVAQISGDNGSADIKNITLTADRALGIDHRTREGGRHGQREENGPQSNGILAERIGSFECFPAQDE